MQKRVIELFAGVGGFRVGLNKIKKINKNGTANENGPFNFVWANQWEPSTKSQHAFNCYNIRFPSENNSNTDISLINKKEIPYHELLVGGFPCQDYSVAHTLSKSKGIEGKKGVLWWQIDSILKAKKPPFVLLENVDRLLKSPAKQRGRDFGIMLRCFSDKGYSLQWRVINAADYGHPQRRKRIFIFAYHKSTNYYKSIKKHSEIEILNEYNIFSKSFPIEKVAKKSIHKIDILNDYVDLVKLSNGFKSDFNEIGYMNNGIIYTTKFIPIKEKITPLKSIIQKEVNETYYLNTDKLKKFKYLRGSKKISRVDKINGHKYVYSEGSMAPFDSLSLPGRTMLTSEGTTNRSTHIIKDPKTKRIRILTPVECERLNQFPDNWTNTGMPENRRYFMMGNALVCGILTKLSDTINRIFDEEN